MLSRYLHYDDTGRRRTASTQLGVNRRFANAKSSMLHSGQQPERRMPYAHSPGRAPVPFFSYTVFERESTARYGSPVKTIKTKPKNSERKQNPRPFSYNNFLPDWNTLHRSKRKKNEQKSVSLSLVSRPTVSRRPRHRFGPGKAFLPLCHNESGRPPRVKPGAHHGLRSPARQSWCSDCVALSVKFSLVTKISTA